MADEKHPCPGPECGAEVGHGLLACPPHWRQVPLSIQRKVNRTWRNGAGEGSAYHWAARQAAISCMRPLGVPVSGPPAPWPHRQPSLIQEELF